MRLTILADATARSGDQSHHAGVGCVEQHVVTARRVEQVHVAGSGRLRVQLPLQFGERSQISGGASCVTYAACSSPSHSTTSIGAVTVSPRSSSAGSSFPTLHRSWTVPRTGLVKHDPDRAAPGRRFVGVPWAA